MCTENGFPPSASGSHLRLFDFGSEKFAKIPKKREQTSLTAKAAIEMRAKSEQSPFAILALIESSPRHTTRVGVEVKRKPNGEKCRSSLTKLREKLIFASTSMSKTFERRRISEGALRPARCTHYSLTRHTASKNQVAYGLKQCELLTSMSQLVDCLT